MYYYHTDPYYISPVRRTRSRVREEACAMLLYGTAMVTIPLWAPFLLAWNYYTGAETKILWFFIIMYVMAVLMLFTPSTSHDRHHTPFYRNLTGHSSGLCQYC